MHGLLQPKDSKRVADALIEKIQEGDFDVALAIKEAASEFMLPHNWIHDWLPDMGQAFIERTLTIISSNIYETREEILTKLQNHLDELAER